MTARPLPPEMGQCAVVRVADRACGQRGPRRWEARPVLVGGRYLYGVTPPQFDYVNLVAGARRRQGLPAAGFQFPRTRLRFLASCSRSTQLICASSNLLFFTSVALCDGHSPNSRGQRGRVTGDTGVPGKRSSRPLGR